jgi:hypothetical protein
MFRHRHHLVFCWLLVCQAIDQEKATVKGLARLAPHHIAEWHLRRLLAAGYWNARLLVWWFADQVIATLPTPDAGVCYLGEHSPFFRVPNGPWMLGVRGQFRLNTLSMGGPDDDRRSRSFA